MLKSYFCLFVWGLLLSCVAEARSIPPLTGPIVEEVQVLRADTRIRLERALKALEQRPGPQINVLVVKSLEGEDINEFSIHVVDQWKLGKKGDDRGVLFVISIQDRKMRIEVGRGLEGDLTDAYSKRIIDEGVRPLFQKGNFTEGILVGVFQIVRRVAPDFNFKSYFESNLPENSDGDVLNSVQVNVLIMIIFVLFLIFLIFSGGGGRHFGGGGPYYGGGFGGGGGGFGGGSGGGWSGGGGGFSGGGASGGW